MARLLHPPYESSTFRNAPICGEREQRADLFGGGLPAVFADLERLGVLDLLALLFAVQFDQLVAAVVGDAARSAA